MIFRDFMWHVSNKVQAVSKTVGSSYAMSILILEIKNSMTLNFNGLLFANWQIRAVFIPLL